VNIIITLQYLLEDLGDDDMALRHLQDLLVRQGTTKSTRKKPQELQYVNVGKGFKS